MKVSRPSVAGFFNAVVATIAILPRTMTNRNFEDCSRIIATTTSGRDLGRFNVTGNNNDRGRVKTPNLRNVGLRKAFMMDGAFDSLEEVVDFYNRGGDFNAPNKDNDIRRLGLNNNERQALGRVHARGPHRSTRPR